LKLLRRWQATSARRWGVEASAGQRATTKTRRIEIRITEEEHNLAQAAATVSGETLSGFVRRAARYEAERTLAEHTRYTVDDEAAQRFLTALEQPSPTSEQGLRRLTKKPSLLPEA
jgi:uncharacterized protein (DUF1778 family)